MFKQVTEYSEESAEADDFRYLVLFPTWQAQQIHSSQELLYHRYGRHSKL